MRPLLPLVLFFLVAAACSSAGPTLVATDEAATPTAVPAAAGRTDDATDAADDTSGAADVVTDATEPTSTPPARTTDTTSGDRADAGSDAAANGNGSDTAAGGEGADDAAASSGCTAPRAGTAAEELSTVIDFDSDGERDRVIAYAIAADGPATWRLRVETAAGESLESALEVDRALVGVVEPLGSADIDGDDSAEELLTVVGAGASTRLVAIHVRQGCELVQADLDDFPITFPVGASVGNTAGLECIDADDDGTIDSFVAWVGVANFDTDAGDYFIDGVEYQLRDGALEQIGNRTLQANIREADFIYGQLTCGDVTA